MKYHLRFLLLLFSWLLLHPAETQAGEPTRRIDFTRDIRPILSSACFTCHGPDASHRKGDLRLDTRKGAFEDRGGYRIVVPGKPDRSELFARITHAQAGRRMPPRKSGKKLAPAQIRLIRRWIEQGASWSQHWAFVPPARPALPQVKDVRWVRNPIDTFVLARLEQQDPPVKPSPEADHLTLFRRLYLDLVGLPPTPEEVDAFTSDSRPEAYERVVDRLLASPAYGERWGRRWLDAARYADSDGFEKDKPREVWFYRDWVIAALNRDLPYNRFIIEQIAGDLLAREAPPQARQDLVVATGFLRNSMINEEGGIDPEQFRMEAMFDRMDAVGKAVLGLTVRCAQCHHHKYDPLTQHDYYRMFAYLNNSHEAQVTVYTPAQQEKRQQILHRIAALEEALKRKHPGWKEELTEWEEKMQARPRPTWQVVSLDFDAKTIGGQKFLPMKDGSYLAQGYAPTKFRPRMTATTNLNKITAIRLELLTDPNLPRGGPGRSIQGTAALTEFEVEAVPTNQPEQRKRVQIAHATADVAPAVTPLPSIYDDRGKNKRVTGSVNFAIDGKASTAWGIDVGPGQRNQPRQAVFTFAKPVENPDGTVLNIYLTQKHGGWNSDDNQTHNLGRFRISITGDETTRFSPQPSRIENILAIPEKRRTPEQAQALFRYWRRRVPAWKEVNEQIEQLWQQHPEGATQLVLMERNDARKTHRLERGDFLQPREVMRPGVPEFLHSLPEKAPPTRLTFARWLVDRRSPTTARALVNRVWQGYFGRGLVHTSEDLGSQGEAPSHPQLLDWLAVEFMDSGWSLKHLHRLIVTSATYRQSSRVTPDLVKQDPSKTGEPRGGLALPHPPGTLLARGPRVRVEAETIRDIALAASGLLSRKMGGRSVYPPAPDFLFKPPASYGPKTWKHETGPDRYRRGLYTFRFRSVPHPALQAFDAPPGEASCVRRDRSNTPLQALTTLNEPLFMECARALAVRSFQESSVAGQGDKAILTRAFRLCLTRKPTPQESKVLLGLLRKQRQRLSRGELNPWELTGRDPQKPALPTGTTINDLAAWTVVTRVLLNLDETITKE